MLFSQVWRIQYVNLR